MNQEDPILNRFENREAFFFVYTAIQSPIDMFLPFHQNDISFDTRKRITEGGEERVEKKKKRRRETRIPLYYNMPCTVPFHFDGRSSFSPNGEEEEENKSNFKSIEE